MSRFGKKGCQDQLVICQWLRDRIVGTCALPLPNPNLRKPKLFPDPFFSLSSLSPKLRALKGALIIILVYFIPSLSFHQVFTQSFPKLYSTLSVNFSLSSQAASFFLEKNMKPFRFNSLKIHAIEPHLVLIAALYSLY